LQAVFFLALLCAGIFAAEVSFLFGLPVLSLGSDYFGIATLGFSIVVNTLMVNSDTILPFPEMKGGRGMIGYPQADQLVLDLLLPGAGDHSDAQPHPLEHGADDHGRQGGRDRRAVDGHRRGRWRRWSRAWQERE